MVLLGTNILNIIFFTSRTFWLKDVPQKVQDFFYKTKLAIKQRKLQNIPKFTQNHPNTPKLHS